MIDSIQYCKTSKEVEDLQARIQGEMALVQAAQIKSQLIKASMDSALDSAEQEAKNRVNTFIFGPN